MAYNSKEMEIFAQSRVLAASILHALKSAPKNLRWSIASRIEQKCTKMVNLFYMANIYQGNPGKRLKYLLKSHSTLLTLGFELSVAKLKHLQVIKASEFAEIGKKLEEIERMLKSWINVTKKDALKEGRVK